MSPTAAFLVLIAVWLFLEIRANLETSRQHSRTMERLRETAATPWTRQLEPEPDLEIGRR